MTGGCLCGAVRFETTGTLRPVAYCHCGQCRKWHGHIGAYTNAPNDQFKLVHDEGLSWFASSDFAQRGFCSKCGSSLFWRRNQGDSISIAAGSLDGRTGLESERHIYVPDKGDYYDITDGLPQEGRSV
jgi:hypothetical protein